jgi:UDP-N-acetylmuramate--alanine ligase
VTKPFTTYGFAEEWDFSARAVKVDGMGSSFELFCRAESRVLGTVHLQVPGDHNVLNALAAAVVALEMGLEFDRVAEGLSEFRGVKRRFEVRWRDDAKRQVVVDDYGHHPTEIAATLAAARGFWPGRIITVFQPHRYSRTLHCHDGFLTAFRHSDRVLLTDIYAAGEEPIEGVSSEALAQAILRVAPQAQGIECVGSLENACREVVRGLLPGDLVLCLGAGTITRLPEQIIAALSGHS